MSGIKFGDYHTGDEWGLFLTDVEVGTPDLQTYTVDVPGRNGSLNLTSALFDEPRYNNRTLTATLEMLPDPNMPWGTTVSDIFTALHGQEVKIVLDDDPDYYYYGTCEVDADIDGGSITISADCDPYKYYAEETVISVASPTTVTLPCDRMPVVPTLVTDAEITIVCGSLTTTLSAGTWTMTALPLSQGGAEWEISGEANVTITYRQGRL